MTTSKTMMMVLGLALLAGAATGCVQQTTSRKVVQGQTCEGMIGQAKVDCENDFGQPPNR